MSSTDATLAPSSAASKKKSKKKGKNAQKSRENLRADANSPVPDTENLTDEPASPNTSTLPILGAPPPLPPRDEELEDGSEPNGATDKSTNETNAASTEPTTTSNGASAGATTPAINISNNDDDNSNKYDAERLEAMGKEREALRAEVQELRKQLETLQESHDDETRQLQEDLEESNTAKETAEEQYQTLLGRVEKIKETLGDRLRRDKQELEEAKERVEELEAENEELRNGAQSSTGQVSQLQDDLQVATRELATLRSMNNLSAQNWHKERDEFVRQITHLKEDLESTSNAMGEWEVIAMEERSVKESLAEKASEVDEELRLLRDGYERAVSDRDEQAATVDKLQTALRDIQEARKRELREIVEAHEEESKVMKRLIQEANTRETQAEEARHSMAKELERMTPFEKEVKEKNLLIGKLRHEAIVLNDHLTKALRYLKKSKLEDNVDRHIVTNYLLHFLNLDRSDPKRFQILQVMAGYLNWTDEQREQAGLARPGTSGSSLRLPASPFNRSPSMASLHSEFLADQGPSGSSKESLADLWAGFLERSVEEGTTIGSDRSRKGSMSSAATGPIGFPKPDAK